MFNIILDNLNKINENDALDMQAKQLCRVFEQFWFNLSHISENDTKILCEAIDKAKQRIVDQYNSTNGRAAHLCGGSIIQELGLLLELVLPPKKPIDIVSDEKLMQKILSEPSNSFHRLFVWD